VRSTATTAVRHVAVELVPFDGLIAASAATRHLERRHRPPPREDQIRESEQRFRDVVEASGEYVWETDAQWRYRYLSKRAESVLGPPDRTADRPPAERFHACRRSDAAWRAG
jgi:PAS domain-containing protein